MNLVLDTSLLGRLCHPNLAQNESISATVAALLDSHMHKLYLPEIADFELRRKLLHLLARQRTSAKSLQRLDNLGRVLEYLPLDTVTMRRAAELWAEARLAGRPSASDRALDADVVLLAQAESVDAIVVTQNVRHFESLGACMSADELQGLL